MATVLLPCAVAGAMAAPPDPTAPQSMLVAVRINGRDAGDAWQLARTADGFYAAADAFAAWRLRLPEAAPVTLRGQPMYPLRGLLVWKFDAATQTLAIDAPAAAFVSSTLDGVDPAATVPTPPPPGGFLNYDVQWAHDHGADLVSGVFEAGVFSTLGVLTTTGVARDVTGHSEFVRLQTSFFRDDPATTTTLRLGDAVGVMSPWGRQVYYGGVQWGTNFATRPDLILLPLPSLHGEAVQPSVVDIYVNNVLSAKREVQPGPFTMNQVPIVTGAGDVRMVVHDALGREQVVNLSYYLSPDLLRQGLYQYTWEGGAQRENLGVASNDYGPWFAATTHRYGLSDQLTVDGRAEVQKDVAAAGAGAVYLIGDLGTVAGGVAGSTSSDGAGARGYAQFQRVTRQWSLGGRVEGATPDFRQIGMADGELPPVFSAQVFGSLSLAFGQSLSAAYVRVNNRGEQSDVNLATLGYSVQFGPGISASLTAFRSLADEHAWGAGLTLSYALDARRFLSGSVTHQDGRSQATVQLQQSLPPDTGFGYDLRANVGDASSAGARLLYQNDYGNYGVEATSDGKRASFLAGATGGIVTMGGHTMFARRVQNSFAIVEVPGAAGADIYSNNQRIGSTDAAGVGFIPNLLAYQRNIVRIDERGLPIEMELDLAEKTVAPYARSGVLVTFAAKRNDGATLTIVTDDGMPMPLGSEVRVGDAPATYRVARRGEVFLPEISYPATVRVDRAGSPCTFTVPPPATSEPLPRLGPYTCRASSP